MSKKYKEYCKHCGVEEVAHYGAECSSSPCIEARQKQALENMQWDIKDLIKKVDKLEEMIQDLWRNK